MVYDSLSSQIRSQMVNSKLFLILGLNTLMLNNPPTGKLYEEGGQRNVCQHNILGSSRWGVDV